MNRSDVIIDSRSSEQTRCDNDSRFYLQTDQMIAGVMTRPDVMITPGFMDRAYAEVTTGLMDLLDVIMTAGLISRPDVILAAGIRNRRDAV